MKKEHMIAIGVAAAVLVGALIYYYQKQMAATPKAAQAVAKTAQTAKEPVIYELTAEDVPNIIQHEDDVVVMVYTPWCKYCHQMKPEYEKAAQKLAQKGITCARLDAAAFPEAAASLGAEAFPHTVRFQKGKQTQTVRGATTSNGLIEQLQ